MIAFPLYIFLFIYLAFLCVFVIFSCINAYHIFSAGIFTVASFTMTVTVILLTLLTLYITWQHVSLIDWSQPFILFEGGNF
ncbi:MAG TPA: hypothetical protein PK295_03750 [Candidatus Magasanikbacteria bacterium]|nr:hypothetical protein [Candidatus Magasanikbacteria bacterium]